MEVGWFGKASQVERSGRSRSRLRGARVGLEPGDPTVGGDGNGGGGVGALLRSDAAMITATIAAARTAQIGSSFWRGRGEEYRCGSLRAASGGGDGGDEVS